jgi:hypothetical protein
MAIGEFVKANNKEDRQQMMAPILSAPIRPSLAMMGEPDKAPVIDPSVNTATINPNLDDYHQYRSDRSSKDDIQSYRYNRPDRRDRA